ncbi:MULTISPECIES: helix-turn-helix domain-containing protein [Bacillus]|nr:MULTISPECIES: helix-turn-helix transcriptional regulator [Bacillus cereus group]PEB07795.1 XRE family transcriptional regulator [Bacillus cereus]AWC31836.1 XRE family transcriptional regulator [Bacillus cytotoxicus]AWC35874.1 XRE family transcriptional regulator [Bacillus cytotoxicus]AWC60114.1 XRE family transcriptional regulator [Bacillus cytotoxicus]KMT50334.1 DNA-binding protein [Bacillus cytotoxicus]
MQYSSFGIKVRTALLERELTITSLASELGISVSYLSDILKGSRKGKKQKKRIADTLGIEVCEDDLK